MTETQTGRAGGNWPTLAELEPVANYIAVRLADKGTSKRKVQDITNVLQYHCVRRRDEGLRIEFGLLGGWLTRSEKDFKDDAAFDVLCAMLTQYADRFELLDDDVARRSLLRSLTDWLTVLTWKFKAFSTKVDNVDKKLICEVKVHAGSVAGTTEAVHGLATLPTGASLAQQCAAIAEQLRHETADLDYQARLAVGL